MNPSWLLINVLKYFRFLFWIRRDIGPFLHSAYSQYTYRSVPCILNIWPDSFCIFSVYEQQNFIQRFTSFRVLSVYDQILSAYSQYTTRFFLRILSIHTDSFRIFRECAQIIWNIWKGIIFFTAFKGILLQKIMYLCNWTKDLQGIINYLALACQKKNSTYSDNVQNDLWIWIFWRIQIYIRK